MTGSVCLFTDSLEPSGVGEHMLLLARRLRAERRVTLVCPRSATGDRVLARAAELDIVAAPVELRDAAAEPALLRWLEDSGCDLLHVHAGIGWEGHHGVCAGARAGVPVVRTEHLPYLLTEPEQQTEYQEMQQSADRIICVSEAARESFRRAGVEAGRLRVVHNGVEPTPPRGDREVTRARLGIAGPLLLTVARMTEQKGHRYLLEAVPRIAAAFPAACFLWVGGGPDEAELGRRAAELGVAERIRFAGPRDDVPELLRAADLLVLPSLFEGFPLVILEALAAGLPVIATRVCGTSEAIEDGISGRLVPPRDPAALASAILDALRDPAGTRRWAGAGGEAVRTRFSTARMVRKTAAVYREAGAVALAR